MMAEGGADLVGKGKEWKREGWPLGVQRIQSSGPQGSWLDPESVELRGAEAARRPWPSALLLEGRRWMTAKGETSLGKEERWWDELGMPRGVGAVWGSRGKWGRGRASQWRACPVPSPGPGLPPGGVLQPLLRAQRPAR